MQCSYTTRGGMQCPHRPRDGDLCFVHRRNNLPDSCNYVNRYGEPCIHRPRVGDRCCYHKNTELYAKCRFFDRCGAWTTSKKNICSQCQIRMWRRLRKEKEIEIFNKEMDEYIDQIILEFPAE